MTKFTKNESTSFDDKSYSTDARHPQSPFQNLYRQIGKTLGAKKERLIRIRPEKNFIRLEKQVVYVPFINFLQIPKNTMRFFLAYALKFLAGRQKKIFLVFRTNIVQQKRCAV